jgi:hypothetical protein
MAKSILAQARSWATRNKLFGTQAFLRYVTLRFLEDINRISDEFIFKGGNLLWIYIQTPRATVDLDLVTREMSSHKRVRAVFEKACAVEPVPEGIRFSIMEFKEIDQDGKQGAAITVAYQTEQGAQNRFDIDIVYALPCDSGEMASMIDPDQKIQTATIENIICDKVATCHRFASGNTRMKDLDDLWRLARSDVRVDPKKLNKLAKSREISLSLDTQWIGPEMARVWETHQKRYKDLPKTLESLFTDVSDWLKGLGES